MRTHRHGRSPRSPRREVSPTAAALLVALAASFGGCATTGSQEAVTTAAYPPGSDQPDANVEGDPGPLEATLRARDLARWAAFGRQHLQDGDLVFRKGRSFRLYSHFMSQLFADITDSPFSHVGIVEWLDGRVWVCDAKTGGVGRVPFEVWMLDVAHDRFAVCRLRPEFRCYIPKALAFCHEARLSGQPYDTEFNLQDRKMYCSELVEKAFAAAGLPLSEPVPIYCLPNYHRYRWLVPFVEKFAHIPVDTLVFAPGNCRFGTFASPYLELVYVHPKVSKLLRNRKGPTCPGHEGSAAAGQ